MTKNYHFSNTDIAIWIENKYKNNLYPELPKMITSYIIDNPDKLDLYLDKNIDTNKLFDHLYTTFKKTKKINRVMKDIIAIVEG